MRLWHGPLAFRIWRHYNWPFLTYSNTLSPLQTVKSGDRVTSAAYGMASMPTQQSGTLMGHSAPGLSPSKAEAPTNGLALRQESLEAIASTELTRSKGLGGSQTLFADVLEQVGWDARAVAPTGN